MVKLQQKILLTRALLSRKLIIWIIIRAILGQKIQKVNKRGGLFGTLEYIFIGTKFDPWVPYKNGSL